MDVAVGSEIEKAVLGDVLRYGRPLFAPVGKQRVEADRIDYRAGKDVGAGFRALFEHHHRDFRAFFGG